MTINKLVLVTLLGVFLGSASVRAETAPPQLNELLGHARLSNAQTLLQPFYAGQQRIKVIVTLRPNQAGLALAKPQTQTNQIDDTGPLSGSSAYGNTYYDLETDEGKQALAAAVDEKLSGFASALQGAGPDVTSDSGAPISPIVITRHFKYVFGFAAEVTLDGLNQLLENQDVLLVEENITLKPQLNQGIPLMNGISARVTYDGSGVAVAVADTGIDTTHPRLDGGKVLGGYDFGMNDTNFQPAGNAHGTAVAGIVAGDLGSVGDYIGGVAPGAKLYGLKISNDTDHQASSDAMIAAWEWALTNKNSDPGNPILVVNTSFGGGRYYSACDTTNSAMTQAALNGVTAGISFFVSSGNDGYCDSMGWPACISHVNSIGAVYDANVGTPGWCLSTGSCLATVPNASCPAGTGAFFESSTIADKVTAYSNSDTNLAFFASSNNSTTTDIVGAGGYDPGDYAPAFGGTSAASPYAAGAAAVLQHAAKSMTGDYISPAQVRNLFATTGNNVTDSKVALTKPRINIGNAVAALGTLPPPQPPSDETFLLNAVPPLVAAIKSTMPPPVVNPQWGAVTELCCDSSSLTYGVTQGAQYRSSTLASCASTASFSGYLATTPGSKFFSHLVTSSACGNLTGSGLFTLDAGKRYLWVAEYNSGNPRFVIYSENLSSTSGNTPAGDSSSDAVPESMSVEFSGPLLLQQPALEGGKFQSITRP